MAAGGDEFSGEEVSGEERLGLETDRTMLPDGGARAGLETDRTMLPDSFRAPSLPGSYRVAGSTAAGLQTPRSMPPALVHEHFGQVYELRNELGAGGMGAVFKAHDHSLHRTVAVKVMHDEVAKSPTMVKRFYKEAQITAQLEHPGIVPTYAIETTRAGQARLAMRLIRGQDMEQFLDAERERVGGRRSAQSGLFDRLELFIRACEAVHFAHKKRVVHRDLKPENIMIGPHRDAYVMDWGLATLLDDPAPADFSAGDDEVAVEDDPRATRLGEMMGTLAYMPPEQAHGRHDVLGPAADQFAMGLTLFEVVTLCPARNGRTVKAVMAMALKGTYEDIPQWVPSGLAAIIRKATEIEPEARYLDMSAFVEDIRRFIRDEELSVLPDSLSKKTWKWLSRHRVLALSTVAGLALLVAALGVTGLIREAERKHAAAEHARYVAEQVALATERAAQINEQIRSAEYELAHLVGSVEHVLVLESGEQQALLRPGHLRDPVRAPEDTRHSKRYGQLVSFERPVVVSADDTPGAREDERRLSRLEADFVRAFRAGNGQPVTPLAENGEESLVRARLHRIYLGTPRGVFLSYPALSDFPPDFDVRERDFFQSTRKTRGPQWGRVHHTESSPAALLPCNQAVFDGAGRLLGVLGIDFLVDDVQKALPLSSADGYRAAWLLNERDEIVASTVASDEAQAAPGGRVDLKPFAVEPVLAEKRRSRASGEALLNDVRYLYARVPSLDWTYVVATAQ